MQAADAAADLFRVPLLRFLCPIGVANKVARGAHEILIAFFNLALRLFGGADEVGGDDGDIDRLFDRLCQIRTPAGFKRGRLQPVVVGVVARRADVDRVHAEFFEPFGNLFSGLQSVALAGKADPVIHFVGAKAHDQRIVFAALRFDTVDDLGEKAQPVFKRAAVFVGAQIGVGAEELLDDIAVGRVELHRVHAGLFAAHGSGDEIVAQLLHGAVAHRVDARGAVGAQLAFGRRLHGLANFLLLEPHQKRRRLEHQIHHAREFTLHGDNKRQRVDRAGVALAARVVKLDAKLCAGGVDPFDHFLHRLDLPVVCHGKLGKRGRCAHIVDAADAGDDESHAAFGARFIVADHLFRRGAVGLAEREFRGVHHHAVFHRHGADVHRRKHHIKHLVVLTCSKSPARRPCLF